MKTVFVGLSGGVDSAVSAALLKEQGYDVVGAFIKIWQPEFIECTWKEDRLDAMRVAVALGIPFLEVDLSESYKEHVIEDMLKNYSAGVTPNPDILCNTHIKFGDFAAWAFSSGADFIATGHYARVDPPAGVGDGMSALLRGVDGEKDQSYFLCGLERDVLSRTLFPIGGMKKSEVRALAERFKLPNSRRPDSQGLCFVGDITLKDFLRRFIPVVPGPVVDMKGNVIGSHEGAALYTIGQRHGFSVPSTGRDVHIHYVTGIDTATNTLRVSENRADSAKKEALFGRVHWIGREPQLPYEAEVETRYREKPIRALIESSGGHFRAHFAEPHIFSPGQSIVIYDDSQLLGSGVINK